AISKGAILIDIREEYHTSMKTFKVDNYFILPQSIFEENIINLPKDCPLIIADASGLHSKTAVEKLLKNGFTSVTNLAGGIMDWERDGFPVEKDPSAQLSGQCPCMLKPMNRTKKS
ncbi:MAG TPA: rhodanese-like domain-containing protein, partial [Paludibacteraceae bacterium]|nr:rhodanese-like domain-containing protein [Paludibacteraceae bacterium]